MSHSRLRIIAVAGFLAIPVAGARADSEQSARLRKSMSDSAAVMGVTLPEAAFASPGAIPVGTIVYSTPPVTGEERTDFFEYPEVSSKSLEGYAQFYRAVVGKGKNRKKIILRKDTGVVAGERLEQNLITHIVIHASLGQAFGPKDLAQRDASMASGGRKYDSCQSSVNFLNTKKSAAHFIVCRDGRVLQMAEIKDFANHVKDPDFDRKSIGIETDTGYADPKNPFYPGDWNPDTRWRQSVSLARLIRMINRVTGGRVLLDEEHIKTHDEVDGPYCARAGCQAHTDPGPYFKNHGGGGESVKTFGDPGATTSPWGNLMRLVTDTSAPKTLLVSENSQPDQFRVTDGTGLSRVIVWKLLVPRASINPQAPVDAAKPTVQSIVDWSPRTDVIPDASKTWNVPSEAGEYEVEARDLVGNRSYTDFDVAPAAEPVVAGTPAARTVAVGERTISAGASSGASE